jgi:hypothetical protein
MDIAELSTAMSQNRVQEAASTQVLKLAMGDARAQGSGLVALMDTARAITDPALGNRVDLLA